MYVVQLKWSSIFLRTEKLEAHAIRARDLSDASDNEL